MRGRAHKGAPVGDKGPGTMSRGVCFRFYRSSANLKFASHPIPTSFKQAVNFLSTSPRPDVHNASNTERDILIQNTNLETNGSDLFLAQKSVNI